MVEYFDEICPSLDLEVAKALNKVLTKQGMIIMTAQKVISGKNNGNNGEITIEPVKGGERKTLQADHILIATGRRPNTESLCIEKAGVLLDDKGRVNVDEHLKTNISNIWAIGDVVKGPMLAHKAEE